MSAHVGDIKRAVADAFGVPLIEMTSQRRSRAVARPRQVAMFLTRCLTPLSLPAIGRHFGGRDHTTVMHAVNVVWAMASEDADFGERVASLRQRLESG